MPKGQFIMCRQKKGISISKKREETLYSIYRINGLIKVDMSRHDDYQLIYAMGHWLSCTCTSMSRISPLAILRPSFNDTTDQYAIYSYIYVLYGRRRKMIIKIRCVCEWESSIPNEAKKSITWQRYNGVCRCQLSNIQCTHTHTRPLRECPYTLNWLCSKMWIDWFLLCYETYGNDDDDTHFTSHFSHTYIFGSWLFFSNWNVCVIVIRFDQQQHTGVSYPLPFMSFWSAHKYREILIHFSDALINEQTL